MSEHRKCPDCGERLSFDAIRCACGWGAKKQTPGAKHYDYRCTFQNGHDRCCYPVGMFLEGAAAGWCIFHRQARGRDAGDIVRQSHSVAYTDAIAALLERNACASAVVNTAWDIALRHGNRPWQEGKLFGGEAIANIKTANTKAA